VTADGRLIKASAAENPDLFWGLRGGGGNFGVVTSFEYRLHPIGQLLGGLLVHPLERARDVLEFYDAFTRAGPDELISIAAFGTMPDGVKICGIAACYSGPIEEGERRLQPLREFGPPIADGIRPASYIEMQRLFEPMNPPGMRHYWKSSFLRGLDDGAVDTLVEYVARAPSPRTAVLIEQIGGAVSRIGKDDTAFNHRTVRYNLLIVGMWSDASEDSPNVAWVRALWNAMRRHSSEGVYMNYLGPEADEGAERVKAAYGAEKYRRLVALKNEYDPTNLFRLNPNIRPSGG
jgi:hypothetical protein